MVTTYGSESNWVKINKGVVTSGLLLYLDAQNSSSYSGSGSTWNDLSGNNNNATLVGSPVRPGGVFTFDGSTQYATVSTINLSSSNYTVMGSARYAGVINGRIITSINNNWLLGHWSNSVDNYYAEGWVTNVSQSPTTTEWKIYAGTGNINTDQYSIYSGAQPIVQNSSAGSQGPNGISIGRWAGGSEWSNCQVGFILVYNRVLSLSEIEQNFLFFKDRYGM